MAELPDVPNLDGAIDKLIEGLFDPSKLTRLQNAMRNAHAEGATVAHAAQTAALGGVSEDRASVTERFERVSQAIAGWFLSLVVEKAFDVDVDNVEMGRLGFTQGRKAVSKRVTEKMIEGLTGGATTIEPSPQPAANYLSVVLGQVFEAWSIGEIVEVVSAYLPFVEKIEHIADLSDKFIAAFGISDSSSRVLRPYIDNLVVEPLRRHIANTYRPNLFSEGEILKAFLRGDYSDAEARKELAELGWTDRRQDLLLKSALKNIGLDDALTLVRHGVIDRNLMIEKLRWQGYDATEAELAANAAELKRLDAVTDNALPALVRAYVNRELSDSEFRTFLPAIIYDQGERDFFESAARLQRDMNVQHISEGEVVRAVRLEVVPMAYYRRWMEREGFPDEERDVKELLLRAELQKEATIAQLRAQQDADRAAERARQADERRARQEEIERQRALASRGPLSELQRAAIRGLIPIARVVEVLAAQYDADTVQIYVDDLEQQRSEYVEQQRQAEDARKRAGVRRIDVGTLEQAVLQDVLTLDEFAQQLHTLNFSPTDANILIATLRARKADLDAAKRARAEAEQAAKRKSIDLGRFEQLVRRGVRTFAQYGTLLASLGFDEPSRAAMIELLKLHVADDEAARKARDDARRESDERGLSLEQFRRAVILGLRSLRDFDRFLVDERYTADAHAVLVAELEAAVAEAEAARRRRDEADAGGDSRALPLSTVARAARLGLVPIGHYQARLEAAGYSDDDIAIELELLVAEIADVKAAKRTEANADAAPPATGLTLAQLAAAVKAGVQPLAAYQAAAIARGLGDADVATLVRVLADELAATQAARQRREVLASTVKPGDVSIGILEDQVRAGALSVAAYRDILTAAGLDPVDVDVVIALLVET